MECMWSIFETVLSNVQGITNRGDQIAAARNHLIPARVALVANTTAMMNSLLATLSTPGGLGTISNLLSHSLVHALHDPEAQVLALANLTQLPANAQPPTTFTGAKAVLVVPVVRSNLAVGATVAVCCCCSGLCCFTQRPTVCRKVRRSTLRHRC